MPRRVQDIVPNSHRSIRDIPLERNSIAAPVQPPRSVEPRSRQRPSDMRAPAAPTKSREAPAAKKPPVEQKEETARPVQRMSMTPPPRHHKAKGSKRWIFILMGLVIIVAGAGYVASVYFSHAAFHIVPKMIPVAANSTYIAESAPTKGSLGYELAAVKGSTTATVPATDGAKVSVSAKGKVTLFNGYSSQSQRLIAGTRLSDSTGRIYRLADSVVIPGYSSKSGSILPGTAIASVTADQPGDTYNISKSDSIGDLSIVAYKGTPRYETMYARLNTDISGGFVGTKKVVSPAVLASTTEQLQRKLIASLMGQVKDTLPEGYITYDTAYVATFSAPTVGGADPKSAVVTVQGTLYGILLKKQELISKVAGDQALAAFDGFAYETVGLEDLDFSIANQKEFSPEKKNSLIIKLKGEVILVGSVPIAELKGKLSGLTLIATTDVLRQYKPVIEIEKSSGEITPPWSKVPSDPDRITIEISPVTQQND